LIAIDLKSESVVGQLNTDVFGAIFDKYAGRFFSFGDTIRQLDGDMRQLMLSPASANLHAPFSSHGLII
jgi:hypothetical protein